MYEENPERIVTLYEDGRNIANIAAWSVDLQIKRLRSNDACTSEFVMQPLADFHFLVTALVRLRNTAALISKLTDISSAIEEFDTALPDLRKIRNVLEHIEEYLLGEGRSKDIDIAGLQSLNLDDTIKWLGYQINLNDAIKVSAVLFAAIQENPPSAYVDKRDEFAREKDSK